LRRLRSLTAPDPVPYHHEVAGFALRKADPSYQGPNLSWDLNILRKDLGRAEAQRAGKVAAGGNLTGPEDPVFTTLKQQIEAKDPQLRALQRAQ